MRHRAPTGEEMSAPRADPPAPEPLIRHDLQVRQSPEDALAASSDPEALTVDPLPRRDNRSTENDAADHSQAAQALLAEPPVAAPPDLQDEQAARADMPTATVAARPTGNLIEVRQFVLSEPAEAAGTTGPGTSLLIPTFWQRLQYWAWHPVSRSSLAVLLVAGLLPLLLSLTQHLTSSTADTETSAPPPVVTVPVTISIPVTITSTPPPAVGTAVAPPPITVVRTTVITTVQTSGAGNKPIVTTSALPPALIGPHVGTKAVICFTRATLELTATGKGTVDLNVTGAATAHRSGPGSATLVVTGQTGSYTVTYAAAGGNLSIKWSALQGACS